MSTALLPPGHLARESGGTGALASGPVAAVIWGWGAAHLQIWEIRDLEDRIVAIGRIRSRAAAAHSAR